jgi:hypothetical protein
MQLSYVTHCSPWQVGSEPYRMHDYQPEAYQYAPKRSALRSTRASLGPCHCGCGPSPDGQKPLRGAHWPAW